MFRLANDAKPNRGFNPLDRAMLGHIIILIIL